MKKRFPFLLFLLICVPAFAQRPPNVVFIFADDLGYGDLGCYGQTRIRTPHLDRLAAKGIRFTQFYAGTAVCAPSRAALLTGRHTGHTAIRGNFEIQPEGQFPLPDSSVTIAELFQRAGYITGGFGKWGLGFPGSEGAPEKQGFDVFFGYNCQRQAHNYFSDHLWQNDRRIPLSNTPANPAQYTPDLIQDAALSFIDKNREQSFFLYLPYTLPHAALQLPDDDSIFVGYKKAFNETPQPVPLKWDGKGYQPQAYPQAAYAAMVTKLDAYVGQVVDKLTALGLADNTLLLFTSDNGPHREGGNDPEAFNSSGGLRGAKRDLYEGGIREPMIASWPAMMPKGTTSDYVGAVWDFLPTFAALTGQPVPPGSDGLSLLPLLQARGKQAQHPFLYWEFHEEGGRQAVRAGKWKGVRLQVKGNPNAPLQLFDLQSDPGETTNVAAKHPAVVQKLLRIMQREHTENSRFPLLPRS